MKRIAAALALWAVLLIAVRVWGLQVAERAFEQRQGGVKLGAVPLFGRWDLLLTWRLVVPLVVGALLVYVLPRVAATLTWRRLLAVAAAGVAGWSLALDVVDMRWVGIRAYGQHIGLVDERGGAAEFVRTYVEFQDSVPVHLQSHPPGLVLWLWASSQLGLSGQWYETVLALVGAAASVVAVLVVTRSIAGDRFARLAAPFVVLAPAAIWHQNADVIVGGVVLTGVALIVLATERQATTLAVVGGAVFGVALLLAYGVALLAIPIGVVAAWRRQWWILASSAATAVGVLVVPLLWGFWWLDGLAATTVQYDAGVATVRPYSYFVVANLAVLALALGPATMAGLVTLRDRLAWIVVGSGIASVAVADMSGMSKSEVERIWQPFMPLILVAGAALGERIGVARWWLAAQVGVALVVQAALRTPW